MPVHCALPGRSQSGRSREGLHWLDRMRIERSAASQTAVRYGFRDLNELTTSRIYEPLRGRPDFSRLVHAVEAIDEAMKEG